MTRKRKLILFAALLPLALLAAFFAAYRVIGVAGSVIKIPADPENGFTVEYFLFLPDTLKTADSTFLLVEPNNSGFVDDSHKAHLDAAYDIVRFGQANRIARELGVPLLIPCFDRPKTNWERYTHALDRDTLLNNNDLLASEGQPARIDRQLLAMIADARAVLSGKGVQTEDKVLLNGFSASGSFVNRFTALYPEAVAGTAAGGINSMVILPEEALAGRELIYPVGTADLQEIAGLTFQLQQFSAVPQLYYMGEADDNDAVQFDDAYSDLEREIVNAVLGAEMPDRWARCAEIYKSKGIRAEFRTYPGIGHETTAEINAAVVAFFAQIIAEG